MKTLDEVIENLSVKQSLKDLGHRPDPDEIADALYYLREYREKKHEISDISTDYIAMKNYWMEQQMNPPLTWDELKEMEGKPVWVEYISEKRWIVIKEFRESISGMEYLVSTDNGLFFPQRMDDKTWQAYRKERE